MSAKSKRAIVRKFPLGLIPSEKREYGEHAEINLLFSRNGSIRTDDIFFGLPESVLNND